jgi:aspartate beta-hydroxylase
MNPVLEEAARLARAGDFAGAQAVLEQVLTQQRGSPSTWLNLAAVRRQLRDFDGAFKAVHEALRIDPRNFMGLLMSASLLEAEGMGVEAATAYGHAIANAPPDKFLDEPTLKAFQHGREVHARYVQRLGDFVQAELADARSQCTPAARRRLDTFVATTLRTRPRFRQEPTDYYFPGLPSIEFYEREEFPWLDEFEASTPAIQRELQEVLAQDRATFAPYVDYADHLPLDQWRELNHSLRWSAFHFYENGKLHDERARRAPVTLAAVQRLPQAHVSLRSPSALYSLLTPRTRIPPHCGIANFRLVVHLPLVLPPNCGFRVGSETRQWREGEAWVFDDTIEHEAWNESDRERIILICDIWNPRLAEEERIGIAKVIAATDSFNGTRPSGTI